MTPEQVERFFAHMDMVDATAKQLDSITKWTLLTDRPSGVLQWVTSVRLSGSLGGGVSVRLKTPAAVWDRDVYGHIEVRSAATLNRSARLNPVEWRPRSQHRNPPLEDPDHSLATYLDRWHPYSMNRDRHVDVFFQSRVGVALPLPDNVTTFAEYLDFCGQVWKCPSIREVPPPPWSPQLV